MDISIKDLFYLYRRGDESVVALRGLYLDISSGECLVITGPNGSGKSTLVKMLTGFYAPSAGKIMIGGTDLSQIDPLRLRREYISSIDQRGNLLPDLTVIDNISLAFSLTGLSPSKSDESARVLLESKALGDLALSYPEQLSAGQRQMCSLLAAITNKPKILIADEPSGELDNDAAERVYQLLRSVAGEATVILITHDSRADNFADRIIRMQDGRVSEEWLPGQSERSVVDPLGWMRIGMEDQARPLKKSPLSVVSPASGTYEMKAEGLSLKYGERTVFEQVDIAGQAGELIAFSSPSGSGKSSLLRILGGIQDPTAGNVSIEGASLVGLGREERAALRLQKIGFLSQGDGVAAQVSLGDYLGTTRESLQETYGSVLHRQLSEFSGGERARIELLKLLATRKPILLLDEPTSQLDERRGREVVEILLNYVREGALVVASTRDATLLKNADRIISLGAQYGGRQ
jgi:ABC-type lipoprotein export system ATPase subunit